MSCGDLFLGILAILFPPIAVWIKRGLCSADSLINILLLVLGYVPGLIHAWYIIARYPERDYDYEVIPDSEGQRVTYYYVRHEPGQGYGTQPGQSPRPAQNNTAGAPLPPNTTKPNKPRAAAPPPPPSSNAQGSSSRPAPPPESNEPVGPSVGAGSDEQGAPPSYSDVVKGDNKIQTQD
ncbi:hypothetical protein B0A52_05345 [Exophiala mesophila]|uniref:Plasma membrane proteolipid 3 n=1 Tax=Exophiala mesophila TaxID=212818 RepID=A0A438N4L8_EXOME|nr:hypothetical protein B0A52_05345 [Exophiala mesophila]